MNRGKFRIRLARAASARRRVPAAKDFVRTAHGDFRGGPPRQSLRKRSRKPGRRDGQYSKRFEREGSLGLGSDENAVRAGRSWRFQPATKYGEPVAASVGVEVLFTFNL